MAEKLVNNTGLSEFATKIKESVPLVGTTTYTSGNISLDSMGSYSLNEIETPFTWIDGKKIYKKTLNTGAVIDGAQSTAHGISNIANIIKVESIGIHNQGEWIVMPFASKTRLDDNVEISVTSTEVQLVSRMTTGWIIDSYTTIYYTKS